LPETKPLPGKFCRKILPEEFAGKSLPENFTGKILKEIYDLIEYMFQQHA
jgi:hypothetical protein